MKKLLILSGKGGTGKTTVASSLVRLLDAKAYADCDVDAPNLHLVNKKDIPFSKSDFYGSKKAVINQNRCLFCGRCRQICRFDAIKMHIGKYTVDEYACEGCGVCEYVCPAKAISLTDDVAGELMLQKDDFVFSTAKLKMGRGNSGKLVTQVKRQLDEYADADIAIIDGSPGIGCPVIASVSGVNAVLIVAEPSNSGISDMQRILKTIRQFGVKPLLCINKYDTSIEKTDEIIEFCKNENIEFVGKIPYDKKVSQMINEGKTIVDTECPAKDAVKSIFDKTISILKGE